MANSGKQERNGIQNEAKPSAHARLQTANPRLDDRHQWQEPGVDDQSAITDDIAPALALIAINDGESESVRPEVNLPYPQGQLSTESDAIAEPAVESNTEANAGGRSTSGGQDPTNISDVPLKRHRATPIADERNHRQDPSKGLRADPDLDLKHSEDTSYHVRQAPAVIHEVVEQPVHEILHEVYERHIHEHEIYHRILPVQEIEMMPARHFVEDPQGRRKEVSSAQIPGRAPEKTERFLLHSYREKCPQKDRSGAIERFTAREYSSPEGDYQRSVSGGGTVRTDQWWVHPPALETMSAVDEDACVVHFH